MLLHHELKKLTLRARGYILSFSKWLGGGFVKSGGKKTRGQSLGKGVRVYKDAVPKTGTKLTPERIAEHFRSLNSGRFKEGRAK